MYNNIKNTYIYIHIIILYTAYTFENTPNFAFIHHDIFFCVSQICSAPHGPVVTIYLLSLVVCVSKLGAPPKTIPVLSFWDLGWFPNFKTHPHTIFGYSSLKCVDTYCICIIFLAREIQLTHKCVLINKKFPSDESSGTLNCSECLPFLPWRLKFHLSVTSSWNSHLSVVQNFAWRASLKGILSQCQNPGTFYGSGQIRIIP